LDPIQRKGEENEISLVIGFGIWIITVYANSLVRVARGICNSSWWQLARKRADALKENELMVVNYQVKSACLPFPLPSSAIISKE
jgi:hypothetical protein